MRRLRRATDKTDTTKIKNKFFVFDVETTCLEPQPKNFVFGCLYGYNTHLTFYSVDAFIKEFKNKKYKGKFIFAHNAEFDLLTVFGNIFLKVDTSAIFNGKFISASYEDITFADSMNIYPTSVEKLGGLLGIEKLDNAKVRSGGLRIDNITDEDKKYCMRDCEIVWKALLRIFELTGMLRVTLPALAMYDFRHNYLEQDLCFSELVDEFYESYYGGRTEAFFIGICNAKVYDINSMYAAAMASVRLPDVKRLKKTENCNTAFLLYCLDHYEGMARVTVVHAETYFGYLPVRMELNHARKLVFPVGEFTTTVNFNELRFAVEQGVVKVKKVFYVIYANPIESIFVDYITDNFRLRHESKNKLEKTIYKNKMNSLYGRFAMRMKLTTTYYEQVPFTLITELKEAARYCDIRMFSAFRPDCFIITENEKFKNSFFSIPTLSSYITSEARVMLLKNLLANENNRVVYCDTDSIFLGNNFCGTISDKLGAFKEEEKIVTQIRGLKNYTYIDADGEERIVIKGISRGSTQTEANAQGEQTFTSQRYIKTKAALRQGREAGERYTMVKRVRNLYDKREVLEDGNTRALICKNNILINATTFIRPKSLVKKPRQRFRYEPQNIREAVMMFFIRGGQVYTQDLRDHVTGNSREIKKYFGMHAKDGVHMDVFCDHVPEEFYTDQIIDVFQDVLLSFTNITAMRDFLIKQQSEIEAYKPRLSEYEFEYDTPF